MVVMSRFDQIQQQTVLLENLCKDLIIKIFTVLFQALLKMLSFPGLSSQL